MHSKILTSHTDVGISQLIEEKLTTYFDSLNGDKPAENLYDCIFQAMELPLITVALKKCGGNKVKAAYLLGINRNTLTKKIKDYNISV